ncbi:MAG: hypothetical protein Q8R79_01965 [Legionellaceae bacterium]|nr:hypothetical protein [Legionellaceae bacterium]
MTLFLILLILLLVIGWHFIFALLGGVLIIGAVGIFLAIASIMMFCVAVLISVSLPGTVALIIGGVFAIWTVVAIVLAPILFPIVLPLFIIYAVLSTRQRKLCP